MAVNTETVDNRFKFSNEYNEKETGNIRVVIMKQNKGIILSIIFVIIVILSIVASCQKSNLKLLYIKYRLNKITNAAEEKQAFIIIGDIRGDDIGCRYYDSNNDEVYRSTHYLTNKGEFLKNPYGEKWYKAVEKLEFYYYNKDKSIFYTDFFDNKNLFKLYDRD